jgi:hypothetical protein
MLHRILSHNYDSRHKQQAHRNILFQVKLIHNHNIKSQIIAICDDHGHGHGHGDMCM